MSLSFLSGRGRLYLIAFCSILSPAAGAAAAVVPSPLSWGLAALALLAGGIAGLVSKVPAFLVGKPLVSPALALTFGTGAAVLVEQAFQQPEGLARASTLMVAVVLSGLAGKPLPMPGPSSAQAALKVLAVVVLGGLVGCSARQSPGVLGEGAFTFKTTPTVPIEKCLELADKQSRAESISLGLTAASGSGAVLASFLAIFLESKAATATSALVSAGAAGGALYADRRAAGLDELLALYGCPRPVRQP